MGNSESSPSASPAPGRKERERDRDRGAIRTRSRGSDSQHSTASDSRRLVAVRSDTPPASTPRTSATAAAASSSDSTHARTRSTTSASAPVNMGNADSKPRPPSRSSTVHTPPVAVAIAEKQWSSPLHPSHPVDVPAPSGLDEAKDIDDFTHPTSPFGGLPASAFSNPPRLPLPIERDPEPTSPILSPQDEASPLPLPDFDHADLPTRASVVSASTIDDEEGADIQQFAMETDPLAPKIPTTISYRGEGRHIYVTGTFASWEKKFRMHKDRDGSFKATMPLTPGTHHIVFLVDGDAKTSLDLPTTVDFANALVNYIEVVVPQSPVLKAQPAVAVPIPGARPAPGTDGPGTHMVDDQPIPGPPGAMYDELSTIQATGAPLPNQQPASLRPHSLPGQPPPPQPQTAMATHDQQQPSQQAPQQRQQVKPAQPRPKYTTEIPQILLHMDLYNTPDDPRYRLASKALSNQPHPPTLPTFMGKSILNATTPQKDDASVLTMPNHTVLNHLATSSIRHGVLATSGTTRYKRKFLTTIMYKPISEDG